MRTRRCRHRRCIQTEKIHIFHHRWLSFLGHVLRRRHGLDVSLRHRMIGALVASAIGLGQIHVLDLFPNALLSRYPVRERALVSYQDASKPYKATVRKRKAPGITYVCLPLGSRASFPSK